MRSDESLDAMGLQGTRCLVVGGRRGLGAAVVAHILGVGARCHATTRRQHSNDRESSADPSTLAPTWSFGDARNPEDIQRFVEDGIDAMGAIDAMIYCAGVAHVGPIDSLTPEAWTEVFETNTRGFALAVRATLPQWKRLGDGCAVALSSQAARRGQALLAAYSASKAAVEAIVRALAIELAPVVRVNAVAPGIVLTDMIRLDFELQAKLGRLDRREVAEQALRRIPLERFQAPEAVAAAVAFLVSPAARDITGHTIAVDGGMTA